MPTGSVKTPLEDDFSRTRDDDRELAGLVRRQYGVASRRQLATKGFRKDAITVRLRSGRLHRVHAGVYAAVPSQLLPRQGWWMAAVLASGPKAVLSHQTAAALWGIRGYSGGAVHVTTSRKSTSTKRIRRHFARVSSDERELREGMPVTSVHRTIFDLAVTEDVDAVVAMLREAEYLNLWDKLSLWDLLERYPAKRGSRKVRYALQRLKEEPPGRKRSKLEGRFAPFLRRHNLPLPRFNDLISLNGRNYEVDCRWPGTNQIVELDGWEGHHTRSAFREDRARDRTLHVAGYPVTHLTWAQLDDEAEAVACDLRVLLLGEI